MPCFVVLERMGDFVQSYPLNPMDMTLVPLDAARIEVYNDT